MADAPNTKTQNEEQASQDETIRQRLEISNGYASLLGSQSVQSFTAFTFEEALGLQIESISGQGTDTHPNQLGRVARIKMQLLQSVEQVLKVDPSKFNKKTDQTVNTPPDG
jgi:hypothetical protein